eukprot:4468153-Amphidinium_carterae.1
MPTKPEGLPQGSIIVPATREKFRCNVADFRRAVSLGSPGLERRACCSLQAVDGQRHVVYAAATPELPSGDEEKQTQPDIATCLKDPSALASFVPWAQQHAKQIKPLLPDLRTKVGGGSTRGGLEPCGCFIVAPETTAKNLAAQLVPVLEGIQESSPTLSIEAERVKQFFYCPTARLKNRNWWKRDTIDWKQVP